MKIRQLADTGEWTTRRYLSLLGTILIWIIVAIDAWYLWPMQLGGDTSIVVVSGKSMEPTFFGGDLVIARKMEPSVGDVIVYAPEGFGGSQIVHRIVGGDATDGWVMQGDNNPRVDPFTPTGSEVKGVVLVHYSNFGRVTVLLLNPMVWAFVLLAAMVLMLWYTGDDCDDKDDDDDEKRKRGEDDSNPESEAEAEPDLIDRMVEGTEAAVSRMVASTVAAGAAALAPLTRRSPAPRHAALVTRHAAPAYLRASAIIAVLGLLAIVGPSTASASSLAINTGGNVFTKAYTPCTTATLGVTYSGTATGGTSYPSIAITGLTGCEGLPLSYAAYGATGQTVASGSNFTVVAGTNVVSPGGTYNASLVRAVVVKVNGWPITNTWTGPLTFPAVDACDGLLSTGQLPAGTTCTLSIDSNVANVTQGGRWIGYALVVDSATSFIGPSGSSKYYQGVTTWRFTLNLTALQYVNYLGTSTSFYVYKYGNENIALAPGATCSNATSVTFQEDVAGSVSGSTLVVTKFALYGWDSKLICQTP